MPTELPQLTLNSAAGDLCYFDTQSDLPVLILLHGNTSCKEVFEHQITALSPHYRIIAPDLPGFGHSFRAKDPEMSYQIGAIADAVHDFLNHLHVKSVDVFGWSLGGHIGIELLNVPQLVTRLVTFGTPLVSKDSPENAFVLNEEFQDFFQQPSYTEEEAKAFLSGACSPTMVSNETLIEAAMHADGRARNLVFKSILTGDYDQAKTVLESKKPVTLFLGDTDPVINFGYQRERLGHLFSVFPRSLHDGFYESHERFNRLLVRALQLAPQS